MKHVFLFLLFITSFFPQIKAQSLEDNWVNTTYSSLNDTQRIGQLIMIRAHSNLGSDHVWEVEDLIKRYHIGSLCFFQGTPEKQAQLTNRYQALSKIPLFIAMDAEWGVNMRFKDAAIAYPKQMALGAIQDNTLIYKFGAAVAKECKRLGVHINFAPDVDVNNNAKNPVINERSFGEDKYNVATKGFMYMLGMQDNGVMACAKHFPGHGDTDVDSHLDLPLIPHDLMRLNALELLPFRVLAQYGIGSLMVAHLHVPALDNTANLPVSLSRNAVFNVIRRDMGYDGLIFTDGLEMKGVTRYYSRGEVSARAIAAGNDILCLPESTPDAFTAIKNFIAEGKIDTLEFEKSVKRVLRAKYRFGLTITPPPIDLNYIRQDINVYEHKILKRELVKNSLTLVRNDDKIVPFKAYVPDSIASLSLGSNSITAFQSALNNFGIYNHFNAPKDLSDSRKKDLLRSFSKRPITLVSLHNLGSKFSTDFGITSDEKEFLIELSKVTKVVLVVFGNPYSLKFFDDIPNLICAYSDEKETQELTAQGLFGVFDFKGKLPVTASEKAKGGMGFNTLKIKQLEWNTGFPEAVGMNPETLLKIDEIANELIAARAAPSCQILVAKDGQVVYHKSFGHHTYEKLQEATNEDLYDIASITKCAATTLSLMKLYEEGKIDLEEKMSKYLPILRGGNKDGMLFKEVLLHQAGLQGWIPFYKNTMDVVVENGKKTLYPSPRWFSISLSSEYPIEVARNLYMKPAYRDSIFQSIVDSPLREKKNYHYSDLGMILMTDVIPLISGKTLDQYAQENFYTPLSMSRTLFNPLTKFDETTIAPTEEDHYFRMQRLRGHVHDMGAAMMGGVAGHAGLFSTARDLAIVMQMLLNKGEYAGFQYLKPETVEYFTRRQGSSTRRAYGWDMKELDGRKSPNMSTSAPASTYGHTGFTGDAVYNDPENNLIYIFLSNRTYPDMNNNKLINGDYRPRIQSVIYEAMRK
jgi:beta-N-acetylhexosaminidase